MRSEYVPFLLAERAANTFKDRDASDDHVRYSPETLYRNYHAMAIAFSINHGCVVTCLAYASAVLGNQLGSVYSGILYVCYAITSFLLGKSMLSNTSQHFDYLDLSHVIMLFMSCPFPCSKAHRHSTRPSAGSAVWSDRILHLCWWIFIRNIVQRYISSIIMDCCLFCCNYWWCGRRFTMDCTRQVKAILSDIILQTRPMWPDRWSVDDLD